METVDYAKLDDRDALRDWKTVDDVVMGGRSSSRLRWIDDLDGDDDYARSDSTPNSGALRFEGTVSLENNGGFCSARQQEQDRGVPGARQLVALANGDGHRYKCTLRTSDTPSSSSWRLPVETTADTWRQYACNLDDFELWRRGTRLDADRRLDPAAITSFGLLISDEQEGPFRLDLAEVRLRLSDT